MRKKRRISQSFTALSKISILLAAILGMAGCDDGSKSSNQPAEPASACGNGVIDAGEDCDGEKLKDDHANCTDWDETKYASGKVSCNSCKIDYTACVAKGGAKCGNSQLDDGEECDADKFKDNKTACTAWDSDSYESGAVSCNNDCTVDFGQCVAKEGASCGNGKVDNGEECDGEKFQNNRTNCKTWNSDLYKDGKVTCKSDCELDYSACVPVKDANCGNGQLDDGEECDGDKLKDNKTACSAWDASSYESGAVSCNDDCTVDYGHCVAKSGASCGNGKVDNGELCDGEKFQNNRTNCKTWNSDLYKDG